MATKVYVKQYVTRPVVAPQINTGLSSSQKAAVDGANNPSASNPFLTHSDFLLSLQFESGSFTIPVNTDTNFVIRYTGADDITVTLPNTLITGKVYTITQAGAGVVTLVGDTGVTVNSLNGLKTPGQGGHIQFWKVSDNVIDTVGGVA